MTQPRHIELATALEASLGLPGAPELFDPQQLAQARQLLDALKNSPTDAAFAEAGAFAKIASQLVQQRFSALRHEQDTLAGMIGKNREVAGRLQEKLETDQRQSQEAWKSFNIARKLIAQQGDALLDSLGDDHIETLVAGNLKEILGSPTTAALTQAMHTLIAQAAALFEDVERLDRQIKALVEAVYGRFNDLPGFTLSPPAQPNLDNYRSALQQLDRKTGEFCRRPIHLLTDKNSLAKKFGLEVVVPLRGLFTQLWTETDRWLKESIAPVQVQIQAQKIALEKREADIFMIREQVVTLEVRVKEAVVALARLQELEAAIGLVLALTGV
ncbi:MAG: hypothetical protein LLG15_02940 [Betaproteobacteria bacterium]|nr:hypothetical protein [Betaproteobacteria bacterium]